MSCRRSSFALLALTLGAAVAAAQDFGARASVVAQDGAVLSGRVEVERLVVPAGATVWVEADLELVAHDTIVIDGALLARPGLDARGASISLESAGPIVVRGRLASGDGADGVAAGVAGGRGGDLRLKAPLLVASTDLVAGTGGAGGPGAAGGDGGDIVVLGASLEAPELSGAAPVLRAGHGGAGGRGLPGAQGGAGGAGGSASSPAVGDGVPGTPGATGNSQVITWPGLLGAAGGPCAQGAAGGKGLTAVAGHGGDGGDGGPAISPAGAGGKGGEGGAGGLAVAAAGGRGGDSGGCCFVPLAGANGGSGGDAGHAFGGLGGSGGAGGAGGLLGLGGDGGSAGAGGSAFGGQGGDGGNGAGGDPPGNPGVPGPVGHAFAGTAGTPGVEGAGGLGPGVPGATAADGQSTPGNLGFFGTAGAFCLEFQTWTQTGFGLPGTGNISPLLFGLGPLSPASGNTLSLFDARPGASGVLFAGLTPLLAAFKGGWLIPAPDIGMAITANSNGNVFLPFNMPAMPVMPGTVFQMQAWFVDDGALHGLSATNGLRARIP